MTSCNAMEKYQKYSTLTVVPWFSSAEWKYVCGLIYGDDSDDEKKKKALNIIYTWKDRVNLLCSGVEGTLIILDALFLNNVPENILQITYASAIMRFINVCINVKDRKCTMLELAKKYGIPTWIIKIRHEFAHDQKLPPLFICRKALYVALEWLKENYWYKEYQVIKDYVVDNYVEKDNQELLKYLELFCDITLESIRNNVDNLNEIDNVYSEKIKCSIGNSLQKGWKSSTIFKIQQELLMRIKQFLDPSNTKDLVNILSTYIIESMHPVNGKQSKLSKKWYSLLTKMYHDKNLILLIRNIYEKLNNRTCSKHIRSICALCIEELLRFIRKKNKLSKNPTLEACRIFYEKELLVFLKCVLKKPNRFNNRYLDSLMQLTNVEQECIANINDIIDIYMNGMEVDDGDNSEIEDETDVENETSVEEVYTKWTLMPNNYFQLVPLGVLPNSSAKYNPVLDEYL